MLYIHSVAKTLQLAVFEEWSIKNNFWKVN